MGFRRTPAVAEAVEARRLFAIDVTGQAIAPGVQQLVFTDIANGNNNGSSASNAQTATLRNTGGAAVGILGISVVDDPATPGDHAGEFVAENVPGLPFNLAPGASATVNVRLRATSVGVKGALLRVTTSEGTSELFLRGIGTTSDSSGEVSGSNEASLQRILNAFQIPVNVGDSNGENTFDLPTPRPAGTAHDEVEMPRLRKAGAGPVVIQGLAEYAFNTGSGTVGHFGTYTPGTKDSRVERFAVNVAERTSTNPSWGATFDPGGADFALYGDFNGQLFEINGLPRGVYSEDQFNTWDANNKKKVRFFPLKDKGGSVVPNAFVFAFEEFNSGYDSNDVVGIIRNVTAAPAGPEVGTESLDKGLPGPTRLVFNRIQQQPPDPVVEEDGTITPLPNNVVHDKAKVRVHNTGTAPLTISSAVLSNTTDFQINTAGLNGTSIAPGASLDVEVQFKATSGRVKTGTLTLNTNDADEGAVVVQLAGFWQNKSENNEEPTLPELVSMFGFGTTIVGNGQQLNVPGQDGKVQAVGDEVLSPYWRRADTARAVEVVQLNAFHTHNEEERFRWHLQGNTATVNTVFTHAAVDSQSLFPRLADGSGIAAGTFKPSGAFGVRIQNEWSDPTLNVQEQPGGGYGHHLRFWPLKDGAGNVVPNTYILGMDYLGINYDYQDNIYIIRNVTPASAAAAPAAPSGVTATASQAGVALNWGDNAEGNLAGYNVYRGTAADFTPGAANKLNGSPLSASQYDDATAPAGQQVFYKITAVNTSGAESAASTVVAATRPSDPGPGPTAPTAPASLVATPAGPDAINLAWTPSTGATRYILDRRLAAGGGAFTVVNDQITGSTFADTGLAPDTAYEYRVSAANAVGQSQPGNTASARTTSVGAPTPPNASVADTSLNEPASGTNDATFTVTLSEAGTDTIVLGYATADGTATAGADYAATTGQVTFAPGETTQTITVPVLADGSNEANETFLLTLNVVSGTVALLDSQGTATVADASAPPPTPGIAFGGKTVAKFTGSDGRVVSVKLKGPGTGQVILGDAGSATISVNGSTTASALTITGGSTSLNAVTVNGSLRSLTGKTVDLAGPMGVSAALGKLLLRNATGSIDLGAGGAPLTATFATVSDLALTSAGAVKAIKASTWLDAGGAAEVIAAPSIASLTIKGDLGADLRVGTIGKLNVSGAMSGSDVRATGDIGTVRAGAMRDSRLFAGVRDEVTGLPAALADFASPATIKGVTVSGKTAGSFSDTTIAATGIGRLNLGAVATDNAGTPLGVAADTITGATGVNAGGTKFSAKQLDDPAESQTEGDFVLRVL